jgi:23S rRNA (guanine745-N1)-methyltransferase
LTRDAARFVCPAGHSFDVARSGYVSLLQPQDRRSRAPGDRPDTVEARATLLAAGIGRAAIDAIAARVPRRPPPEPTVVIDLGCGSGELLAAIASIQPICGLGIDISTAAVDRAARHASGVTWVVANAERRLPVLDASVDVVLSLNARRNPAECARVSRRGGTLIVGVPAADDLIELRTAVQGEGVERERADAVIAEHAPLFDLAERFTARERHRLEGEALRHLLRSTYRGARSSAAPRVEALDALDVTLATEIVTLRLRS